MRLHDGLPQGGCQAWRHLQDLRMLYLSTQRTHFIRFDVVAAVVFRSVHAKDANIAVASRTKIIENTSSNGFLHQRHSFRLCHILLPHAFHDGHGCKTSTSHGGIVELCSGSVGMNLIDSWTVQITPPKDQGSADVSLVTVQTALQKSTGSDHSRRGMCVHSQQLQLRSNQLRDHFRIRCRSSTTAHQVGRQVVDLFTVLFGNFASTRSTRICTQNNTILVNNCHNRSTRLLGHLGQGLVAAGHGQDVRIPHGIFKREARGLGSINGGRMKI
mmetsp:Transcript_6262/g.17987  ORF Transcript_6262/g.17987 Transcript_6262/m.17987 type:complete len:272 (+) Transcript_6262:106-921(+)